MCIVEAVEKRSFAQDASARRGAAGIPSFERCIMVLADSRDRDGFAGEDRSAAVIYLCLVHVLAAAGAATLAKWALPYGWRCIRRHWRKPARVAAGAMRIAWRLVMGAGLRLGRRRRRTPVPQESPVAMRKGRALYEIMRD